ncbi:MAG: hypothetical protein ACXVZO_04445, partial [Gaiellaceae bacterium]
MSGSPYVLGHSEHELERLARQAALIAAELVGEEGSVVGVDLAPSAVAAARERVAGLPLRNVSFLEGDPA